MLTGHFSYVLIVITEGQSLASAILWVHFTWWVCAITLADGAGLLTENGWLVFPSGGELAFWNWNA